MENMQKRAAAVAMPAGLIVAVVGSRSVMSCRALLKRLDALLALGQVGQVVSGGAVGVDTLAASWAMRNLVPLVELRPDYAAHGAGAPHVRNAELVRRADLVLVVWDGQSRGTLSAARAAARLGRRCEWLAVAAPSAGPVAGGARPVAPGPAVVATPAPPPAPLVAAEGQSPRGHASRRMPDAKCANVPPGPRLQAWWAADGRGRPTRPKCLAQGFGAGLRPQ